MYLNNIYTTTNCIYFIYISLLFIIICFTHNQKQDELYSIGVNLEQAIPVRPVREIHKFQEKSLQSTSRQ